MFDPTLTSIILSKIVANTKVAYVQYKTNYGLSLREIAASVKDILLGDIESSRAINLFEWATEKAKVIVFPL